MHAACGPTHAFFCFVRVVCPAGMSDAGNDWEAYRRFVWLWVLFYLCITTGLSIQYRKIIERYNRTRRDMHGGADGKKKFDRGWRGRLRAHLPSWCQGLARSCARTARSLRTLLTLQASNILLIATFMCSQVDVSIIAIVYYLFVLWMLRPSFRGASKPLLCTLCSYASLVYMLQYMWQFSFLQEWASQATPRHAIWASFTGLRRLDKLTDIRLVSHLAVIFSCCLTSVLCGAERHKNRSARLRALPRAKTHACGSPRWSQYVLHARGVLCFVFCDCTAAAWYRDHCTHRRMVSFRSSGVYPSLISVAGVFTRMNANARAWQRAWLCALSKSTRHVLCSTHPQTRPALPGSWAHFPSSLPRLE